MLDWPMGLFKGQFSHIFLRGVWWMVTLRKIKKSLIYSLQTMHLFFAESATD